MNGACPFCDQPAGQPHGKFCNSRGKIVDGGMRDAMLKLSRTLGDPKSVDARIDQCVDAALIELAAEKLATLGCVQVMAQDLGKLRTNLIKKETKK